MIKDIKILGVIIFISLILFGYTFTFDEVPEILAQGMQPTICLLYTSDAADDSLRVDLGGRRIIKRNAFITFGYTLFIVLIADKLGFLISVFLFTLITPILWQRKDYVKITLYSLCMTIFVFVFFTLVLQLKFPQGILEDFIIRNFY